MTDCVLCREVITTMERSVFKGVVMPESLREGFARYVVHRIETGQFLRAVLENDLTEAVGRAATVENVLALPALCGWLYNHAPPDCYGSRVKVTAWLLSRRDDDAEEHATKVRAAL